MMINKAVFYASEVAAILGYSTHTVYHLIHTKQLPAFRDCINHVRTVHQYFFLKFLITYTLQMIRLYYSFIVISLS